MPILIVDDEEAIVNSLLRMLKNTGYNNVRGETDSRKVTGLVEALQPSLVLLDLIMPNICGEELIQLLRRDFPEIPIIVFTGNQDVDRAVDSMKLGVFDYYVKNVDREKLCAGISKAIEISELRRENTKLRETLFSRALARPEVFAGIISRDPRMHSIFSYIEAVAGSSQPFLISGETGTGKELIANAIHELSGREGKMVSVNVAGLDEMLFADTLFGHAKGAFTGAAGRREGLVEGAAGGTLFLDEIGELSPANQIKLLRLIDYQEYYPLGSDVPRYSDALVITAGNNIISRKSSGEFRNDLYFRLNTHHIELPPLRDRKGDIPLLLSHFLHEAAAELKKAVPTVPPELIPLLSSYSFPGNIRELRSLVYDAVSTHSGRVLSLASFRSAIGGRRSEIRRLPDGDGVRFSSELPTISGMTEILIEEAMQRADGNQSIAAGILGISQQALSKRLKKRN
jgi:DNA-binding NtrC family response regulator